jgi:hypothetical protein
MPDRSRGCCCNAGRPAWLQVRVCHNQTHYHETLCDAPGSPVICRPGIEWVARWAGGVLGGGTTIGTTIAGSHGGEILVPWPDADAPLDITVDSWKPSGAVCLGTIASVTQSTGAVPAGGTGTVSFSGVVVPESSACAFSTWSRWGLPKTLNYSDTLGSCVLTWNPTTGRWSGGYLHTHPNPAIASTVASGRCQGGPNPVEHRITLQPTCINADGSLRITGYRSYWVACVYQTCAGAWLATPILSPVSDASIRMMGDGGNASTTTSSASYGPTATINASGGWVGADMTSYYNACGATNLGPDAYAGGVSWSATGSP